MYVLLQLMSVCILAAIVVIATLMQEVCFGITPVLMTAIATVFDSHSCCDLIMTSNRADFPYTCIKSCRGIEAAEGTCQLPELRVWTHTFRCAGVEPDKLQAEEQSNWPHRLHQHSHRFPRWLPVCIWWQGQLFVLIMPLQYSILMSSDLPAMSVCR